LAVIGGEAAQRRKPSRKSSEQCANLEQELRAALGTKVDIKQRAHGRGQLVIHFTSHEEFDRLREHLTGRRHSMAG
jgi:ParB family transcriptional regulator, chromosome partitioning protein